MIFKKRILTLFLLFFTSYLAFSNPILNVLPINCDSIYTFSVTGSGDANWPNYMNGQGCRFDTSLGGGEIIYEFIVPLSGTYQFNVLSGQNNLNLFASYYYKYGLDTSNIGWTCLERVNNTLPLGAFNWVVGDTILFLVNAENTDTTTQTFRINCATNVCENIQQIYCDSTYTFDLYGYGDPNWSNTFLAQGCGGTNSQGGLEIIYEFIAPTTGTYQFNVLSGQSNPFNYVRYYYKYGTNCSDSGWICMGKTDVANPLGALNLIFGDTLLILINAEDVMQSAQTFRINCATRICDNIQAIYCDSTYSFNVYGFGDPNFPINMPGAGCGFSAGQGGQEIIYRFIVPEFGMYQLNVITGQNDPVYYVNYYYKNGTDCSDTGWICLDRIANGAPLGAFDWNTGDTILLLANAENIKNTIQTFQINCATHVCDTVHIIHCDSTNIFSVYGYGDPDWPISSLGQTCHSPPGQGGLEKIYAFVVPTNGTYQFNIEVGQGNLSFNVNYLYKIGTDCNNTGWTCVGSFFDRYPLDAYNWTAGDTILILANAENNYTTTQAFRIGCAKNICDIIDFHIGDTIQFSTYGYGDSSFPNGLNGIGCSNGLLQGGQETIYRVVIPATGLYTLNSISSNGQWVDYYLKDSLLDCTNANWQCIDRNNLSNAILGYHSWTAGDTVLFLLNAESVTDHTLQSFTLNSNLNIVWDYNLHNIENVKVYPNPTNGTVTISLEDLHSLRFNTSVIDPIGNILLKKFNCIEKIMIDLNDIALGVYLIRVDTDKGSSFRKLIKQ